MKQVLVKVNKNDNFVESLMALRDWCRRHTRRGFRSYLLKHYKKEFRFVVFEFDCDKEAMKFELYTGT